VLDLTFAHLGLLLAGVYLLALVLNTFAPDWGR